MEREEFHKIKGYFGYEVSLNGHVRRTSHGKTTDLDVIQPFGRDVNYVRMKIGKDHKEAKVSYLIALAFLPKERGDVLICMNGDWNDYSIDNYMWVNPRTLPENNSKEWRRVKGFNKKYEVSEDGEVRNYRNCKVLSPYNLKGHLYVKLYDHGLVTRSIAILVAEAFLDPPDTESENGKRRFVGHLDGNITNNHYSNLVWGKYDVHHSAPPPKQCVPIDEYTPEGHYVQKWTSLSKASSAYDISLQEICNCCKGRSRSAGGRVWRFEGEPFNSHKTPKLPRLFPNEYFKPIPGTYAEVSNYGRIRDMRRCGVLYKVRKDDTVPITTNGKTIAKKVFNYVAEAFLPNPNGYKRVGFKDGNPRNWRADNLMWLKDMEHQ